ncbi:Outer membrane protein beta-barrel domain-containing protein [Formosa sp. Hel1_31_208]|uniref:outer membrane beta-barrel protein n=1 Tax=Formosa sp. Hel1_31_208 TaxID=1798225 RepID=UPI000879A23D|nr:outer membrane beta-barrel protein [Formosa sp. Hel1_31_208]SDS11670.1 Outer membrane protein beta-barrel domain-containing protein [Formosa sp. Hel1_31_208]
MIAQQFRFQLLFACIVLISVQSLAQDKNDTPIPKTEFYDLRGTNAIDVALGTTVINGDFIDPMFEIYSHIGYKRHLTPYLAIDFGYHKFNLAYIDTFNEGFMSFDLNVELLLLPHEHFSPYLFVGAGYNAANHFKQTAPKVQGGIGLEYIVSSQFALKLYSDYNYVSSDTLDGLEAGASDDTYFRLAFGLNFYFGGTQKKTKLLKDHKTVIEAYSITDDENSPKL